MARARFRYIPQVSSRIAIILIIAALAASTVSLLGSGSFSTLISLRRSIVEEELGNQNRVNKVIELRNEIDGLMHDDRALERAARNRLGLARPNELIFFFDDERASLSPKERLSNAGNSEGKVVP